MAATCDSWQLETENVNGGGGWIVDSGGWRFGWWFLGEVPLFYVQLESNFSVEQHFQASQTPTKWDKYILKIFIKTKMA